MPRVAQIVDDDFAKWGERLPQTVGDLLHLIEKRRLLPLQHAFSHDRRFI